MNAPYVYTPDERTSHRFGLFLLVLLGLGLTMVLFFVKTHAQDARTDVTRIEAQIEMHEAAITVLVAERTVLVNSQRMRLLAEEKLGLQPITVAETTTLTALEVQP